MNEYLKQYIELQKQFRETKGNPDSVRALYTFKEKLEQSEDKQAKEVLVDVYDLLDFKKDAYELLCQKMCIRDRTCGSFCWSRNPSGASGRLPSLMTGT